MPRSDEAQAFFHAVYSAVQEIPHGKVTTYGHIAMLVGTRTQLSLIHSKARVTNILQLKDLVKSQPGGSRSQADALQAEGVQVETNAMGEHSVDFSQYGWFPDLLPSEENDQGE
ncbi:MGMT family [Fusarium agapanthi]|uniref:MGMT family n=1 Tax=Fusarium agapanthi TaxID=1803897 RepID=A0A9P5EI05_9HYPO|nr:MGMT family [Fusarium agapanthi]